MNDHSVFIFGFLGKVLISNEIAYLPTPVTSYDGHVSYFQNNLNKTCV